MTLKVKLKNRDHKIEVEVDDVPVKIDLDYIQNYIRDYRYGFHEVAITTFRRMAEAQKEVINIANRRKELLEFLFAHTWMLSELSQLREPLALEIFVEAYQNGSWIYNSSEPGNTAGHLYGIVPQSKNNKYEPLGFIRFI